MLCGQLGTRACVVIARALSPVLGPKCGAVSHALREAQLRWWRPTGSREMHVRWAAGVFAQRLSLAGKAICRRCRASVSCIWHQSAVAATGSRAVIDFNLTDWKGQREAIGGGGRGRGRVTDWTQPGNRLGHTRTPRARVPVRQPAGSYRSNTILWSSTMRSQSNGNDFRETSVRRSRRCFLLSHLWSPFPFVFIMAEFSPDASETAAILTATSIHSPLPNRPK